MDDCIFCKIVDGKIPAFKIAETDNFLAFLDICQFVEGHTLIIPKKHFRFIWDIDNVGEYYEFAVKIANHYRKIGYKYIDSASFGRMVPHAHYHLVPHNDEGSDWESAVEKLGEMQSDPNRRISKEKGELILKKFQL